MIIGQLSLYSVPPEKRGPLIGSLLEQVKNAIQTPFALKEEYVCGIRSLNLRSESNSAMTWTMEWVAGRPPTGYIVHLLPQDSGGAEWQVEMVRKWPFSGGILGLPEAVGACIGLALRWAIVTVIVTPIGALIGKPYPNMRKILHSTLLDALQPDHVLELATLI